MAGLADYLELAVGQARFTRTYRVLLHAARAEGLAPGRLPDFLELEHGGELALLGQDELGLSVLDAGLREQITRHAAGSVWSERDTERILLAAARVGQHVFARYVLRNCGSRCVFCGFSPAAFGARRMLLAGHIKPWKDSTPGERLDPRNGLAACPAHDVAFDTGLLTVNGGCGSMWPARWPMPSGPTRSPGSTTGSRHCARNCYFHWAPSRPAASTSTGTGRRSSSPDPDAPVGPTRPPWKTVSAACGSCCWWRRPRVAAERVAGGNFNEDDADAVRVLDPHLDQSGPTITCRDRRVASWRDRKSQAPKRAAIPS